MTVTLDQVARALEQPQAPVPAGQTAIDLTPLDDPVQGVLDLDFTIQPRRTHDSPHP